MMIVGDEGKWVSAGDIQEIKSTELVGLIKVEQVHEGKRNQD